MQTRFTRAIAAPMAACLISALTLPAGVAAQGFDFDEDEVEGFDFTEEEEGFGEDDWGDDEWGNDDWDTGPTTPTAPVATTGPPTVTGLFVPGNVLDPIAADRMTDALNTRIGALEGFRSVSNESLRTEFEIMGAELAFECAFDPVCMGRYARQLDIAKVVVGRIELNADGTWGTTINIVDAASGSIENYRFFNTAANATAVETALEPQLRTLFGLRRQTTGGVARATGPSTLQRAMAWTTLGLGVGALGAGVAFGLQASSIEDELLNCTPVVNANPTGTFTCEITQRDAQTRVDDGKSAALLSNVFLGTGILLVAGSVLLFTITPGSDIDDSADLAIAPGGFRLTPVVGASTVGVSGAYSF